MGGGAVALTKVRTARSAAALLVLGALALLATSCVPLPPTTNFRTTFGSTVYGTWDGGATWHATASTPTYPDASSVVVTDMTYGPNQKLIATGYAVVAMLYHALIWTSPDGGNTWTIVVDSPPRDEAGGEVVDQSFVDVTCTGSVCAALGWNGTDPWHVLSPFTFVETSNDGGATWTRGAGTFDDRGAFVAVASTGTIVVAAKNPGMCIATPYCSLTKAVLHRSADHGASWAEVYRSPPLVDPASPTEDVDTSLFHGVVDAGGTFVAVGSLQAEVSQTLRSTDDGLTWQPASTTFVPLAEVANGTHVVVVTSNAVEVSDDAGATFVAATTPPAHGVSDADHLKLSTRGKGVVLVGTRQDGTNVVFTSNDGGMTWTQKTAAQASGLTAPAMSVAL
jgi:hypothetical protein